jgi:ferrous iron transport protein B
MRATSQALVLAPRPLVLVGTPNVGKSALFGALTGRYATVSNYPGTTVEVNRAEVELAGSAWEVIDTPGTDGLRPAADDARVTRDVLLRTRDATVLLVCDAKNLRRGLMLLAQLGEAEVPTVLALNMSDEAGERGIQLGVAGLARALGIPVVETVATQKLGIDQLARALPLAAVPKLRPEYGAVLERAIGQLLELLPAGLGLSRRALALQLLAGDETLLQSLGDFVPEPSLEELLLLMRKFGMRYPNARGVVISRSRLKLVEPLVSALQSRERRFARKRSVFDAWTTHSLFGVPLLALVLFAAYEFVGVFGAQTAVNFLEGPVFRDRLVPLVAGLLPWPAVREAITGQYGLLSMGLSYGLAIVLPIVTTFFISFSILEDSGYLPRLAVMLNYPFKAMGLNGKAVLPMILGLGCDTMATVTTRVLETRRERILVTLLLALAVPCSAQLAVILAMLGAVHLAAALWFVGTLTLVLLLVGFLAARLIPGEGSDFVLELPPLRWPSASNVLVKTVARVEWYLKEALPLFVLGTAVLQVLDKTHALAAIEHAARPLVVGLLQLPEAAAGAFLLGFLRRDYAAAGLFSHYQPFVQAGTLTRTMEIEIVVALVTITLFLPCIANFIVLLKERGVRVGLAIAGFVFPFSFGVGALVNLAMRRFY